MSMSKYQHESGKKSRVLEQSVWHGRGSNLTTPTKLYQLVPSSYWSCRMLSWAQSGGELTMLLHLVTSKSWPTRFVAAQKLKRILHISLRLVNVIDAPKMPINSITIHWSGTPAMLSISQPHSTLVRPIFKYPTPRNALSVRSLVGWSVKKYRLLRWCHKERALTPTVSVRLRLPHHCVGHTAWAPERCKGWGQAGPKLLVPHIFHFFVKQLQFLETKQPKLLFFSCPSEKRGTAKTNATHMSERTQVPRSAIACYCSDCQREDAMRSVSATLPEVLPVITTAHNLMALSLTYCTALIPTNVKLSCLLRLELLQW